MSLSVETLAVARKYTDDSLAGTGAVAGVPCKIQSITAITGGNRVTFLWTDNNGDDHTSAMDVMNGVDGEDGKGIQSVSVNAQNHLIITYTDGTTVDAGQIEIHSSVDSVNGQTGAVVLDAEDVGALPDNTPIPSKTSDLTNDSGFATTSDVSTALADYTKTADLTTLLAAKQDTLTFDNAPTENSNNPVKSGGVYAANQTLTNYVNNGIYYDGAKNLLPLLISKIKAINTTGSWSKSDENDVYTISGVTYTITSNANGVITNIKASGTGASSSPFSDLYITLRNTYDAFAMYELIKNNTLTVATHAVNSVNFILDGQYNDSWKTVQAISGKADITLNISTSNNVQTCIRIVAGRTVTNEDITPIMAQKSLMDIDDSFSPYAKTNQQLTEDSVTWDNLSEVGAVNMLPNTATTQTINGVTFTVNSDGTVTANGTATANAVLKISDRFTLADYIGRKYVDAKKNKASSSTYSLIITYRDGSGAYVNETYVPTEGFILSTISNATLVEFGVFVKSGQSVSNLTFKPMITVASYNGDYVPYAKNNRELTTSATTNAKNISTINKGTFDIDAIELTANTPKKVISSYGVYLITFNHGGGAPGGLYLVQVHATDVNGMQVAVIKESTDRTVSFDLTVVNQLTVTASGNGRMRIIKLDASNY